MSPAEIAASLDVAYREAMLAKDHIFKAQDAANYVDGFRPIEDALRELRSDLEAFDRLCRRTKMEMKDA